MDENRKKVIEICNNLIGTINKIPKDRRIYDVFKNEMFNSPIVRKTTLLKKVARYKAKYDIKKEELIPLLG